MSRPASPPPWLLAASLSALLPGVANADDLRVPQDFGSLGDALDAAQDCDTILLAPGTYAGTWWIDRDVLLRGDGDAATVILDGDDFGSTLGIAGGARVENLTITSAARGIDMFGPWTEVGGVRFSGLGTGIRAEDASGRIHDCVFTDVSGTGIDANRSALWIDDTTFIDVPVGLDLIRGEGRVLRASTSGAQWGLRVSQSTLDVQDSDFVGGDTGVFVQGGTTDIVGCRFDGNTLGVHVFDADATLLDSDLTGNGVAVLTNFATANVLGNRITGSTDVAVHDGIGSASRVSSNLLADNAGAALLQLADTTWRNNTVIGGSRGLAATGGAPTVRSSVFVDIPGAAIDADSAAGTSAAFNLFWSVGEAMVGLTPDGSDLFLDPLLDTSGAPGAGSPAIDAGDPAPGNEDPDGTRADLGHTGGPDRDAVWDPPPPGPPTFDVQEEFVVPEGWSTPIPIGPVSDPNDDPLRITWDADLTDGLQFCDAVGGAVDVTPPDDGPWPIRARVTDPDGNVAEVEIAVAAVNEPPELWWELESEPLESVETNIFVDVTDPSWEDTHRVDVDVDDDGVADIVDAQPGFVPWVPAAQGSWTITVTVTDDDGGQASATQTIAVGARPSTPLGSTDCDGCATTAGDPSLGGLALGVLLWRRRR